MPAPYVVASALGQGFTSAAVTTPPQAIEGDLLVAVVCSHNTTTPLTHPAGWTVIEQQQVAAEPGVTPGYMAVLRRWVTAAEPATHTWTTGIDTTVAAMILVRDVDTTTPVHQSVSQINLVAPAGSGSGYAPSITTTVPDTLIVAALATTDNRTYNAWAVTDPGVLTEYAESLRTNSKGATCALSAAPKPVDGPTGALTVSWYNFVTAIGALVAFAPVVGVRRVTRSVPTAWDVYAGTPVPVTAMVETTWRTDAVLVPQTRLRVWDAPESVWRVLSGAIPDRRLPTPPRSVALNASSGALTVTWQPPWDDGAAAISGYGAVVTPEDAPGQTMPADARSATFSGLSNGRTYTVSLWAINQLGSSADVTLTGSPAGPWVIGQSGSLVGAPPGWGGNGGVNNGMGYYAATEPPEGVTSGAQMSPAYCGVKPVLDARGLTYADLKPINTPGDWYDARGIKSGIVQYDPVKSPNSYTLRLMRDGAIVEWFDLKGTINVQASNCIIRYGRIDGRTIVGQAPYLVRTVNEKPGTVCSYLELICSDACAAAIPNASYTARYCHVWNVGQDAFKTGKDCCVEFNYVHDLRKTPGAHADAHQITDGDNGVVRFNYFGLYEGNPEDPAPLLKDFGNAATITGGGMTGHATWFAYEDNFCDGGGYIIRAGLPSPFVGAKGTFVIEHFYYRRNRLGRKFQFGPLSNLTDAEADQIFDDSNVWHDSGPTYWYWGHPNAKWYNNTPAVADQPIKQWSPARNGLYVPPTT